MHKTCISMEFYCSNCEHPGLYVQNINKHKGRSNLSRFICFFIYVYIICTAWPLLKLINKLRECFPFVFGTLHSILYWSVPYIKGWTSDIYKKIPFPYNRPRKDLGDRWCSPLQNFNNCRREDRQKNIFWYGNKKRGFF